jgi:hypothetical protein
MIDLETAKTIVVERVLAHRETDLRTPAILLEDQIEEHEWGWVFHWRPKNPEQVPEEEAKWGYFPILVDRITGNIRHVGTAGIKLAIAGLLWDRERK